MSSKLAHATDWLHQAPAQRQAAARLRAATLSEMDENPEMGMFLKNVPLLSRLTDSERNKLGSVLSIDVFQEGKDIVTQGDIGHDFYMIKEGKADVVVMSEDGKSERIVASLRAGDYFGETALLEECRRTATVRAGPGNCVCFTLNAYTFHNLFSKKKLKVAFAKRNAIAAERHHHHSEEKNTEKGPGVVTFLESCLVDHILFDSTSDEHRQAIIQLMWREKVPSGTAVIRQGDEGNHFYVIEDGQFAVSVNTVDELEENYEKEVQVLYPGNSFGELALMYNSPRSATVTALCESYVWVIDRVHFRDALQHLHQNKAQEINKFLEQVPLLSPLYRSERGRISNAVEQQAFKKDAVIMNNGDLGNTFYIVSKGRVKVGNVVLGPGDHFGEECLLSDKRAELTVALDDAICFTLKREEFLYLLGPLEQILAERANERRLLSEDRQPASSLVPSTMANIEMRDLRTVGLLGKGSFGLVTLVKSDALEETFALKQLSKQHLLETEQERSVQNEKTVMGLLDHPFVVKLHRTYKDKDCLYLLMDVCLGGDLFSLLRSKSSFSETAARFYAGCIVLAFEHMHSKNIIHRDLKPENVLIMPDGYPKLTDFGFSKRLTEENTWTLCGTPDYLAPEIVQGMGHNKAVDWWTLGILIFEMLASYPPFFDDDPMHTYARIVRGKVKFPAHFSKNVVDLLKKLLQGKPTKRIGSSKDGSMLIKNHPWFADFDWTALVSKTMPAPFTPDVDSNEDLGNFDSRGIDVTMPPYTGTYQDWDEYF